MSITLNIVSQDNQEVVLRVVGEITRRSLIIRSLSWTPLESGDYELVVTISGEEHRLSRIAHHLDKLVHVLDIRQVNNGE